MAEINLLQQKIKTLLPAYFALVMATGVLSIGAFLDDMLVLADVLFYINMIFLLVLVSLYFYRVIFYRDQVLEDFRSYQKGPGFFTIVAALCIVGNQLVLLFGAMALAEITLFVAAIAWLIIIYGFFFNITVTKNKKSLKDGISGTWLVIIVAIQALSTLISLVSEDFGERAYIFLFLALCLFLLGCIFYLYIMSLIIYRISFFSLNATELGAPYWINMGATAISTLAGSMLILHTKNFHFIVDILAFLRGFTLFFWAAGTWWIPLLIILGIWRHLIQKEPVPISAQGYDPTYWAMVFPLGMYTVCTFRLSEALEIPFLKTIPEVFIYAAIFAWIAVIVGFLRHWLMIFRNQMKIS
ncbi:MAG TPA: tellurite resistance/C4-dicarboxylate transporter family protein [Salinimicrobium sp.]|nr:tellurite resistance/C4-dicarboxylate transporter family protein [Salinimicrobium sp.]